ncbi:MAG: hypothetical protein U1F36_14385 [Planctomycetota bacterium]
MNTKPDQTKTTSRKPFDGNTTMEQVLGTDPALRSVLMRFHIGGCSMCGFDPSDTLTNVANDNGVPLPELLDALNKSAR